MGLTIQPGHIDFAYGEFARFRELLAKEEGIVLRDMQGFGGNKAWDWETVVLKPLLDHSDCDGFLTSFDCEQMLPRLRNISDLWRDRYIDEELEAMTGPEHFHWLNMGRKLDALIDAMDHCAEHKCAVAFT